MIDQLKSLMDDKLPLVSNLSNAAALLYKMGNVNWCGFYLAQNEVLYLGPFQGDVACTVIPFGKGVCGTAAAQRQTIVVDDVNTFCGHIACSALSKSEIVVPIVKNGTVVAVIDVDAPIYSRFSQKEKALLEEAAEVLAPLF